MNKDHINELWHEAELASVNSDLEIHQIFYNLIADNIRADEREACAKVCEEVAKQVLIDMNSGCDWGGLIDDRAAASIAKEDCANAIRARGEVK